MLHNPSNTEQTGEVIPFVIPSLGDPTDRQNGIAKFVIPEFDASTIPPPAENVFRSARVQIQPGPSRSPPGFRAEFRAPG